MATAEAGASRGRIGSRGPSAAMSKATAVGAFVLGGLAICVMAILLFGGSHLFTAKLRVVVFFKDSVAGLSVGAPVTLRGVQVGTVQSMKVYIKLPELVPVIPVYLDLEPRRVSWSSASPDASAADLEAAIKAGLCAQLATQSLVTGQVSVNLDFHPEKQSTTVGGDDSVPEIAAIPSDFQHIKNEIADLNLADLTDKARIALIDVDAVLGELRGKIGPLADDIKQTSEAARTTLETATEAVRQLQGQTSQTLASVQGQVQTTGQDLGRTLADLRQTTDQANKALGSLNDIVGARSPIRGDLESTLRDLATAAGSLRDFSREVDRHPNQLLLGRPAK